MISLQLAKSQREGIRCGAGAHTPCPVPSVSPDVPQCPNCLKRSLSPTKVTLLPQAQRTFEQPRAPGRHRENRAALAGPALSKSKQDKGRCTHSRLSHPAWLPCCMPQVVLAWLHQAETCWFTPDLLPSGTQCRPSGGDGVRSSSNRKAIVPGHV